MALEAVVFPQNPFSYSANKDLYNMLGGTWSYDDDDDFLGNQTESSTYCPTYGDWNPSPTSMVPHFNELHLSNNLSPDGTTTTTTTNITNYNGSELFQPLDALTTGPTTSTRPKRRRSRSRKNKEDIENQRMTHIAVERNRRKQMNEYLSVLRSLMPDSYVQRGDQASIIGGAINFVKELEQQVQFLGAQKEINEKTEGSNVNSHHTSNMPFSEFFTFPQYSTSSTHCDQNSVAGGESPAAAGETHQSVGGGAIADIEVTMVESHANLRIRSKRRSKQLVKMVSGLHSLRLTVLHLNVTTEHEFVLYSLSVKVEDDCNLTSVDEIATAVYQIIARIQEETMAN